MAQKKEIKSNNGNFHSIFQEAQAVLAVAHERKKNENVLNLQFGDENASDATSGSVSGVGRITSDQFKEVCYK